MENGGFFPEADNQQDVAWFLMDAMKMLGMDAVGMSEKELRWGISYFKSQVKRTGLPVICANLTDAATKKTIFPPYVIKKVGNVRVGFFGLMSDKVELGIAKDSLKVEDPSAAATRTIAEMRKKGATVVVLLSSIGKVEAEDLVAAIPGVDAVICGRNVPMLQKGRMIKNTVASYGGEQGQYMSRTLLTVNAKGTVSTGENETYALGPEVGEKPDLAKLVKEFEDKHNEKMRKIEKERIASQQQATATNSDRFLGSDLCMRCHIDEGEQWKTTSHSMAWQTLIDVKKDATPECIPCHVVGYQKPGGFQSSNDASRLANVQCENCHGEGTRHEAFSTSREPVSAGTCITCHHGENDPTFNWEKQMPLIAHDNTSGQTIKNKKVKPGQPQTTPSPMGAHGHH